MNIYLRKQQNSLRGRILSGLIAASFLLNLVIPPPFVQAQVVAYSVPNLPPPGTMVPVSVGYTPALIKGITIHPENHLQFDFIVDTGDSNVQGDALKDEASRLIKYFLATLTVPEDELWVNLSPYEKDRIIPEGFGQTEMGRDLLTQDYLLKQLTASLMYPEEELGSEFWQRVYQKAQDRYGRTDIPLNTFNKVWIVPDKAVVYEHEKSAFVIDSHLKVMLEEDYLALQKNIQSERFGTDQLESLDVHVVSGITSDVVKEILLPEIEREVNEGKNFTNLRQIYNSMILATWYKQNLRQTLLGQLYVDKNKVKGVDVEDKAVKEKIYQQYLEAFKRGVYDYIKEDYDPTTQQVIPRKYFSGGTDFAKLVTLQETIKGDPAMLAPDVWERVRKGLEPSDQAQLVRIGTAITDVGPAARPTRQLEAELTKVSRDNAMLVAEPEHPDAAMLTGSRFAEAIKISSRGIRNVFLAGAVVGLTVLSGEPPAAQAVTPAGAKIFASDNELFDQGEYVDPSGSTYDLTDPQQAGVVFDKNLNSMLREYVRKNDGHLIPPKFPDVASVLQNINPQDQNLSFDDVAETLRQEFSRRYARAKGLPQHLSELVQLERETTEWLMDFIMNNASYDQFLDTEGNFMALRLTIIGNQQYPGHDRTYVCKSISDLMVILGRELGLANRVLSVVEVLEDFKGVKYPTPKGEGHQAVLRALSNGERNIMDQGIIMGPESPDQHELIKVYVSGDSYRANLTGILANPQATGETLENLSENLNAMIKIRKINEANHGASEKSF